MTYTYKQIFRDNTYVSKQIDLLADDELIINQNIGFYREALVGIAITVYRKIFKANISLL